MRFSGLILIFYFSIHLYGSNEDKAKNLYDSGDYSECVKFTNEIQFSPDEDIVPLFYRALSFYKLNDFRESKKAFLTICEETSEPEIKDKSSLFFALSKIKLNEIVDGAVILTGLLNSAQRDVAENSRLILETLIYYKLNEEDFIDLSEKTFDKNITDLINQSKNSLKILAVLPLSGTDKDAGKEILTGIEFAIKPVNYKGKKVKLDIVNSEGKIPVMTKKVLDRLNSSRYNLIIGELRSDATAALAGIATLKNIPLISPTASENDISEISKFIFQLNSTSHTLGKKIAEYAIDSLNYKTFAVLSPATNDGNESVSGFTEKVLEKGCSVISSEWYFDTFDLNKQLQRIREKILSIDSLDVEEYMTADSIKAVTAGVVDAFFLPVPNSDIESVASQVFYYNFKANMMGTYGWNDIKTLNKLASNADSLVYIKETSFNPENSKYNDFVFKFRKEYGSNPKLLEITGYSLMEMLLKLQDENPDKTIFKILSELREYDSLNGKVIFHNSRSNLASDIFMYSEDKGLKYHFFESGTTKDSLFTAEKLYNSGYVDFVTRHYRKAVDNYLKSLDEYKANLNLADSTFENDSRIINIYRGLADSYFELKDFKKARIYFDKVLMFDPDDKYRTFNNAVALSQDKPEIALNILESFINDNKYSSEAYLKMGHIYTSKLDSVKALECYKISAEQKNKKALIILKSIKEPTKNKDKNNFDW